MANDIAYTDQVMQDSLRDKLSDIFVSMEKNLNLQTQTLSGMYKLQKDSFIMEKNRIEDQQRAERFARDEDNVSDNSTQTPERVKKDEDGNEVSSSITSLVADVIKGLSVSNLIKGVGILFLADVVTGYIEKLITDAFGDDTDGDGQPDAMPEGLRRTLFDAIVNATALSAIGRLFGRRIAAIAGAAGFVFTIAQDAIDAMNSAFGTELDSTFWGGIATIIAGALAFRLPAMIGRYVAAGIAGMRLPRPPSATAPRPGVGASQPRTLSNGQQIRQRNWTREMIDGQERFRYSNGNLAPRGSSVETSMREAYQRDQALMQQLEGDQSRVGRALRNLARFARVNAAIGALISIPRLYEISMSDIPMEEKKMIFAEELGALGGGILGGAIGALGGSVVPGLGTFIGGAIGGLAGSFYGAELAKYAAGLLLGDGEEFDPDAAAIGQLYDDANAGGDGSQAFVPRPTQSGVEGDFARADWDARFSGYLNPETGGIVEGAMPPERPDESQNYGLDAVAWDRQWSNLQRSLETPTQTNLPTGPTSATPVPLVQQDQEELMARTQAYIDRVQSETGPQQVTIVGNAGEQVGSVVYQDQRSISYFLNQSTNPESSLRNAPFF